MKPGYPLAASASLNRGFTVVEMLVVLVISSLAVGILMQSLAQVYGLMDRFGIETTRAGQDAMALGWWRSAIEGLTPDLDGGQHAFHGEGRTLAGLSLTPVDAGRNGAPTPVAFALRFDAARGQTQLLSGDPGVPLLAWPGNTGRFLYEDDDGQWLEQWPPPLGLHAQLPRAVMLESRRDGEPLMSVGAPLGPRQANAGTIPGVLLGH